MNLPKKSLGQHWLHDEATLNYIANAAELFPGETVLEIGPGTGTLTRKLIDRGVHIVAVEKDQALAAQLKKSLLNYISQHPPSGKVAVVEGDILKFDLLSLAADYKVVANIPYYLTSNLLRVFSESKQPPDLMVLLVQKEVAARIAAEPGQMSLLAISVQLYYQPMLGQIVPAELFDPPPKVDSQVIILRRHAQPLFKDLDSQKFFQLTKAGFSQRRKKLRGSLSGGLQITKDQADDLLERADINPNTRAQELSLQQWHKLSTIF